MRGHGTPAGRAGGGEFVFLTMSVNSYKDHFCQISSKSVDLLKKTRGCTDPGPPPGGMWGRGGGGVINFF